MRSEKYCIGLDIGTASCGYAVTDMEGKLLKHQKHSLFGVSLFESAETATKRRMKRSLRRRLERRKQRIDWLQALLDDEIGKVDPDFYHRLNESFLHEEDRKYAHLYGTVPKSIWIDGSGEEPKTIYHLRFQLCSEDKQADIRYIYLAMHHIIKYRGNFLYENETMESSMIAPTDVMATILQTLTGEEYGFALNAEAVEDVISVLKQKNVHRSQMVTDIVNALAPDGKRAKNAATALGKLLVGLEAKYTDLLPDDTVEESKINFSAADFDEDNFLDNEGDGEELFSDILSIYRWYVFYAIREDGLTVSEIMLRRYEKHAADLKMLKSWFRKYASDEYDSFFRTTKNQSSNYSDYIHYHDGAVKQEKPHKQNVEDFYKALIGILNSVQDPEAKEAAVPMIADMKDTDNPNAFLPLQRVFLNGVFPNQMHAEELSKIIDKQGKYYPSLLALKDKIMSLCTFRLPYYVGPLNTASPFQKWLVRKEGIAIRPWNFYDVVDKQETANGFIRNLSSKCTYLPKEDVLPLNSLLYQEYELLDELNRVRVNGHLLSTDLKEKMIEGLFKKQKNVTARALVNWMRRNDPLFHAQAGEPDVSGLHDKNNAQIKGSLSTYIDFVNNGFEITEETMPMIEELILWSTIFENRTIVREKITEKYPELTDRQVNFICRKRYKGWGRLSRKLLDGITGEDRAEGATIIEMMRMTSRNFMMVINASEYGFDKKIAAEQEYMDGEITYDEVAELPGSPALKRGVWQSVRIVKELIGFMGHLPEAIYIENTRDEDSGKKGRMTSKRWNDINKLYAADSDVPQECRDMMAELKNAPGRMTDRQYLYLTQKGKCLYSGKPLNFNTLEVYQIDHILPQSYIKDDSLDNRALVISVENQRKADDMLLSREVQERQARMWHELLRSNYISRKKYDNLTRTEVDDNTMVGFINRQLVETSQIIRHTTDLFRAHYPEVKVAGVNAKLSSGLREIYDLPKIRELNDSHHAYDAFLAATVGSFVDSRLPWMSMGNSKADVVAAAHFAKKVWNKGGKHGYVLGMFSRDLVDSETGELLWDSAEHAAYLKKVLQYHDHYFSYRKYENSGEFYKETKNPAGTKLAAVPLKSELAVEKYGGYGNVNPAYIAAIVYRKGKKMVGELINVPIAVAVRTAKDPNAVTEYIRKEHPDAFVLRENIPINQLIEYEGDMLILKSCSEAWNGRQLYLSASSMKTLGLISKSRSGDTSEIRIEDLKNLLDELIKKLEKHYGVFKNVCDFGKGHRDSLKNEEEYAHYILETLKATQIGSEYPDYSAYGGSSRCGRMTTKRYDPAKVFLVEQSVTGIYERRVRLWDSEQS